MAPFDPYHNWLGIPPHEQPASFYRLLGLVLFESNPDIIAQAADRQSMHIASLQNGPNGNYCQQLMGEISQAAACLLDPQQKASYDHHLQESLSARGERSVMAAPPPPSAFGMAGPGDQAGTFNGYGPLGSYSQPPTQNDGWSSGEMPMPQFNLPPALGAPAMGVSGGPNPMVFGGMNPALPAMNAMPQPMPSYLPGPPSPILPSSNAHSQNFQNQNFQNHMQSHGVAQHQLPMPQARGPQPAPFPKAPRPIPVASRAGNSAPSFAAATGGATAATAPPPQPPPAAPPRSDDELPNFAATPIRRRFKKKRNQVPTELIFGGIVLASAALGFVIYAYNNLEKHGFDQIDAPKLTVTTAADAAGKDLKQAQAAKDSSKKTNGSAANSSVTNSDNRSRSITTVVDPSKRPNRMPPSHASSTAPVDKGQDEIVPPHQFGPPPHGLIEESGSNSTGTEHVHADGPPGQDVMENVIGSDPKNPKN